MKKYVKPVFMKTIFITTDNIAEGNGGFEYEIALPSSEDEWREIAIDCKCVECVVCCSEQ